eukprot:5225731-Amphidinium_carterae.1
MVAALDDAGREVPPVSDLVPEHAGDGDETMLEEDAGVKAMRIPRRPTPAERDEHECHGHVPFRSWCDFCCMGRGRMAHHRVAGEEAGDYAAISIDYGYLNEKESEVDAAPILCVKDTQHRWVAGHVVTKKGVDEFAVEVLANELVQSGHTRIHLRSDQEPSIM